MGFTDIILGVVIIGGGLLVISAYAAYFLLGQHLIGRPFQDFLFDMIGNIIT